MTINANRHKGLPLEVEPVTVHGRANAGRYCVYFRPWNVGIFIEPVKATRR